MRWSRKRDGGRASAVATGATAGALALELETRGVPVAHSGPLAARLAPRLAELGAGSRAALIDGAVLAFAAQATASAGVSRGLHELQEVERLMRAFSGELSKLDEVLEVLAAYVRRMRTTTPSDEVRTLH